MHVSFYTSTEEGNSMSLKVLKIGLTLIENVPILTCCMFQSKKKITQENSVTLEM